MREQPPTTIGETWSQPSDQNTHCDRCGNPVAIGDPVVLKHVSFGGDHPYLDVTCDPCAHRPAGNKQGLTRRELLIAADRAERYPPGNASFWFPMEKEDLSPEEWKLGGSVTHASVRFRENPQLVGCG